MATLAEIRSKLKEQEQRQSGNNTGGDNAIYPFWNIKEGDSAVLRFLPDGNKDNTFVFEYVELLNTSLMDKIKI